MDVKGGGGEEFSGGSPGCVSYLFCIANVLPVNRKSVFFPSSSTTPCSTSGSFPERHCIWWQIITTTKNLSLSLSLSLSLACLFLTCTPYLGMSDGSVYRKTKQIKLFSHAHMHTHTHTHTNMRAHVVHTRTHMRHPKVVFTLGNFPAWRLRLHTPQQQCMLIMCC